MSEKPEALWVVMKRPENRENEPHRVFRTREAARKYAADKAARGGTAVWTIERTQWGPEQ